MRVYSRITERPVKETMRLREEHVNVERRPVNRPVSEADVASVRRGETVVPVIAEEAVVSKEARVVEQIVVTEDVNERTETVRCTDVDIEPLDRNTEAKRRRLRQVIRTRHSSGVRTNHHPPTVITEQHPLLRNQVESHGKEMTKTYVQGELEMLAALGYALIGLVVGLCAKKLMPGKVTDGALAQPLLGIFGAVIGGRLCLMLLSYGRARTTHTYTNDDGATLPAYWMSFLTAGIGALLVLAVYKLAKGKWSRV